MVVGKMQTINRTEMPISIFVRLSSLGDNSLAEDDAAAAPWQHNDFLKNYLKKTMEKMCLKQELSHKTNK
jgi:hypothetical protein